MAVPFSKLFSMSAYRGFKRASLCISLLTALASAQTPHGKEQVDIQARVYDVVLNLMQFPKDQAYIKIANGTLNTGCGEASGNPVLMNNCGMFGAPATAEATYPVARQAFPNMQQSTWIDLLNKSKASRLLQDSFHTSWTHEVSDIGKAAGGRKADGVIFLSAVGLSARRDEALVYVLFFSYMEHVPTSANLFLCRVNGSGEWRPTARLAVVETQ